MSRDEEPPDEESKPKKERPVPRIKKHRIPLITGRKERGRPKTKVDPRLQTKKSIEEVAQDEARRLREEEDPVADIDDPEYAVEKLRDAVRSNLPMGFEGRAEFEKGMGEFNLDHFYEQGRRGYKMDNRAKVAALRAITYFGTKAAGARAAGVFITTFRRIEKNDPVFAAHIQEAMEIFKERLEVEVYKRGVHGWKEPIVQKGQLVRDDEGNVVTTQKYDSQVFQMYTKRHIREYRDQSSMDLNVSGGLLVIPASGSSGKRLSSEEFDAKWGNEELVMEGEFIVEEEPESV